MINGCEFGRTNRLIIERMEKKMDEIIEQNKVLYNHQSSRFPPTAVWAISILSAITGGVIINFATKFFGGVS